MTIHALRASLLAAAFLSIHSAAATGFDTLTGDLPDVVRNGPRPYLVPADVSVPPGKTVVIEPGTRLLFRNFTGLLVYGTLLAKGTAEAPIIFTSENDPACGGLTGVEPAPYDWNGITVSENAVGTTFERCEVLYSLFGINALADYVSLKDCVFKANGKSDFVHKGVKQQVAPGLFSYLPLGAPPPIQAAVPRQSAPRQSAGAVTLRILGIAALAGGAALAVWKVWDYSSSSARASALAPDADPNNKYVVTSSQWEEAQGRTRADVYGIATGLGACLVGGMVVTITLF